MIMMDARLTGCDTCGCLSVSMTSLAARSRTVPGTGELDCSHLNRTNMGSVQVEQLVHVTLSTLLRSGDLEEEARILAHRIQERFSVPDRLWRVSVLPWALQDDYNVSSEGLAVARVLAAMVAKATSGEEAFYWQAAASIMRRRMR